MTSGVGPQNIFILADILVTTTTCIEKKQNVPSQAEVGRLLDPDGHVTEACRRALPRVSLLTFLNLDKVFN